MGLVLRRTVASAIDALIILLLLLPIFFVSGTLLLLFGQSVRYSAYEITLGVAFVFALLGSLSMGWLPTFGKRRMGIHVVNSAGETPSKWRVILRLLIFFAAPTVFLYGSHLVNQVASLTNPNTRDLLLSVALFTMYLASLFLPASIVATRGVEGLHDRLAGVRVTAHHSQPSPSIPTRVIAARAFIIATVGAVLVTSLFVGAWIASGTNPATLQMTVKEDPVFSALEKLLPPDKYPCRSFITSYTKKAWADLRCGRNDGDSTTRFGIPNGPYEGKVLGLAYEIGANTLPLYLVTVDRLEERVIPRGTPTFSAYLFLDSIAYHNSEVFDRLTSRVIDKLVEQQIDTQFPVVKLKLMRFVSVGTVTIGFRDEIVLHDRKVWRDTLIIDWPAILKFGQFYPPPRTYITEIDVR